MGNVLDAHADKIQGTLSCFDRMLFRGYLPLDSGWTMASFLEQRGVYRSHLKSFLLAQAERLKRHARGVTQRAGRPFTYLAGPKRKEDRAREIAEKDGIDDGLGCIFSVLEPSRTFSPVWKEGHAFVQAATRKCLFLYDDVLDRECGLIDAPAGPTHRADSPRLGRAGGSAGSISD